MRAGSFLNMLHGIQPTYEELKLPFSSFVFLPGFTYPAYL